MTSNYRNEACVFPGRFQPFHIGHAAALSHAASGHARVVVAISNAHISHTETDPFTGGERFQMIDAFCTESLLSNKVVILPVPVNDEPTSWVPTITAIAPPFSYVYTRSSLTASLFDYWKIPIVTDLIIGHLTSATAVRDAMTAGGDWRYLVPPSVAEVLTRIDGERRVRNLSKGRNYRVGT